MNDLNGPLYILDKETKQVTTYLNFNGREGHGGLFHKFRFENGQANGFVNFLFDPDYAHNGKFYTIHLEDPSLSGSTMPDNANFPMVAEERSLLQVVRWLPKVNPRKSSIHPIWL